MNAPDSVEDRFWRTAACLAVQAPDSNRHRTYEAIKSLYQSNHPYANHIEYEQAMSRIARLCRV